MAATSMASSQSCCGNLSVAATTSGYKQKARSVALKPGSTTVRSLSRKAPAPSHRKRLTVTAEVAAETVSASSGNWVPLIPVETLPRGERRLVNAAGETILLLWYKNEVYAIENSSPAEGAYAEGLFNARLTQDGCIVCPLTDSTFDLKTGEIKEWYPGNPIMRMLTRPLRIMRVYPLKIDGGQICVDAGAESEAAELVFARAGRAGETATDVVADEIKMIVDESELGFGFNARNELVNGRAAMIGFFFLIVIELVTGRGLLGATGFLDFLYAAAGSGPSL